MFTNKIIREIQNKNYFNGKFHSYEGEHFDVISPIDLELIAKVPNHNETTLKNIISSAENGLNLWKNTLPQERAKLLIKLENMIYEHIDLLAEIVTLENGKTLEDARREILYGANFIGWFASQAMSISGYVSDGIKPNQKIMLEYEAIGVVAAITPWNFPSAMVTRKIAPALAAGCSIILKPSELTPLSALAIAYLADLAGFPRGVLNVVTCRGDLFSTIISEDHRVRKISFTGSTQVGKILQQKSWKNLQKLSLELGGNSPFIICSDADLEKAAQDLINAKIRSTGQACTSPNRIFIHSAIYSRFIKMLYDGFINIKVGDGFNKNVTIGTLINKKAVEKIDRLIQDAVNKGATILLGGKKSSHHYNRNNEYVASSAHQNYYEPTIILDCKDSMEIFHEEIFGPVLACYEFNDVDEVIKLANSSRYGLASYVYTENISCAHKISNQLDYGIVGINESIISNQIGAFGGRNESGYGVEGSKIGIYEFLQTKYKCLSYT